MINASKLLKRCTCGDTGFGKIVKDRFDLVCPIMLMSASKRKPVFFFFNGGVPTLSCFSAPEFFGRIGSYICIITRNLIFTKTNKSSLRVSKSSVLTVILYIVQDIYLIGLMNRVLHMFWACNALMIFLYLLGLLGSRKFF